MSDDAKVRQLTTRLSNLYENLDNKKLWLKKLKDFSGDEIHNIGLIRFVFTHYFGGSGSNEVRIEIEKDQFKMILSALISDQETKIKKIEEEILEVKDLVRKTI